MFRKLSISLITLFIAGAAYGQTANSSDTTITIKVKGVTCKNDLVTLADNVKELKGVGDCKSVKSGPVSEFMVTFNKTLIGTKEIFNTIESTPGCSDPKDRPYKIKNK